MSFIKDVFSRISDRNSGGAHVEVTTDKHYWMHSGKEASKLFGAVGAIFEIIQNFIEAFFDKIRVLCCQDGSYFSFLVLAYGEKGEQLKDDEYLTKLMRVRVNTEKAIGIHAGEGEKKACSGQIYDKEDGYYVRGTINVNERNEEEIHMIMWDGKGNDCVGGKVFILKPEECVFYDEIKGCKAFAGVTRSNFMLESVSDEKNDCELLEETVRLNIAPALESNKVSISFKFGNREEYDAKPYDIGLKEMFNRFPEIKGDKNQYFEKEYLDFPELSKYHLKAFGVRVKSLDDDPDTRDALIETLPDCYLSERSDGKSVLIDKILMVDDYYVYYSGKIDSLFKDSKSYKGYDSYMLIVIKADTEFYRNFGYDSCKIRGLRDPFSEQCITSLAKSLRYYISANLRQGYQVKVLGDKGNLSIPMPDFNIDTTAEYGEISMTRVSKKDEFGDDSVELVFSASKYANEELGIDPTVWKKAVTVVTGSFLGCMERYLNKSSKKKMKNAELISGFMRTFLTGSSE